MLYIYVYFLREESIVVPPYKQVQIDSYCSRVTWTQHCIVHGYGHIKLSAHQRK